jgi:hypothetical protein
MSGTNRSGVVLKPIYSYVIRIYRRDADAVAGVIEDVRSNRTAPLKSAAELWQVLTGTRRLPRRPTAVPILPSHRPKGPGSDRA